MLSLRLARVEDCPKLVELFDLSNPGLIKLGFDAMRVPGEDWIAAGARMMARPDVEYSIANTIVAEWEGVLAGMVIFSVLPDPMPEIDLARLPRSDHGFACLKQCVPGAAYLRNMGVFPTFRGRRIGEALVSAVISSARRITISTVAGIVHETNTLLLAHYAKRGMREAARHPVQEHPSYAPDSSWILLKGDTERAMRMESAA